jgi:hypothetical protein
LRSLWWDALQLLQIDWGWRGVQKRVDSPRPASPPFLPPQTKPRGNSGDEIPGNWRPRTRDALGDSGHLSYHPHPARPAAERSAMEGPRRRTRTPSGQLPRSLAWGLPRGVQVPPLHHHPQPRVTFPITPSLFQACTPEGRSAE